MDGVRKILVVEDETELREIIVSILNPFHRNIVSAENGAVALELMKQEQFSLVLSDIQMPVMNGLEFFAEAKQLGSEIPVVFITAFSDKENMLKALRLGAFDFIKKPFDETEVLSVVDRALEVGYRRNQILSNLSSPEPGSSEKIKRDSKMIQLLELSNFKKRA